jgi:hypothetical protein
MFIYYTCMYVCIYIYIYIYISYVHIYVYIIIYVSGETHVCMDKTQDVVMFTDTPCAYKRTVHMCVGYSEHTRQQAKHG